MADWILTSEDKKNVTVVSTYVRGNEKVYITTLYRWGSWLIMTKDGEVPDINLNSKDDLIVTNLPYFVLTNDLEDEISVDFEFENVDKDEEYLIKDGWFDDSHEYMCLNDWGLDDNEVVVSGRLSLQPSLF
jgi:hypothetical protein